MTQEIHDSTDHGVVQNLREIRNEISDEIKDMTFEEEKAYLNKLLSKEEKPYPQKKAV